MTRTPEPRTAASVMLLREREGELFTWVIERVSAMTFAAGMLVFPGGKVEPTDADLGWSTDDSTRLATWLGVDGTTARGLCGAAIRETFEETGALLASPRVTVDLRSLRTSIESDGDGFAQLLTVHHTGIDAGSLVPWSRWITPIGAPRRFDTWFFALALPEDLEPSDVSRESAAAYWAPVRGLLESHRRGQVAMLMPTVCNLEAVAECGSLATVYAQAGRRSMSAVRPDGRRVDG